MDRPLQGDKIKMLYERGLSVVVGVCGAEFGGAVAGAEAISAVGTVGRGAKHYRQLRLGGGVAADAGGAGNSPAGGYVQHGARRQKSIVGVGLWLRLRVVRTGQKRRCRCAAAGGGVVSAAGL